jgi:DNA-binding winged helix-turn-helix (wHTH) protein/Flp pilus assembly protein TadD
MEIPQATARVLRFGVFELDEDSGELRKRGVKVRLADQPLQILRVLLDRPGQVVTRQEIQKRLWDSETFVDFDVGLNSAIRKLREALDDSAENPRFIETLPRRGYRFVGSLQSRPPATIVDPLSVATQPFVSMRRRQWTAASLLLAVAVIGTLLIYQRWHPHAIAHPLASAPARTSVPPGIKPEAYEAYLKGVSAAGQQTSEGFHNAVGYFETAVARQPDYAVAHTALAQAQLQLLFTGPQPPREVIPKAETEARAALQLDDTIAEAHRVLGTILQLYYWKWEEGEKEFNRARALGNSDDLGAGIVSLIRTGQIQAAVKDAERARILDPLSFDTQMYIGIAYRAAGQYEQAIAALQRAKEILPRPRASFQLGITFVEMGRTQEAIKVLETALNSSVERNQRIQAYLGYAYAAAGRRADARVTLTELEKRRQHEYVSWYGSALIYDALGDKDAALRTLERAYDDHAVEFGQFPQYPAFKTIAGEPRYEAIMMKIRPEQ